MIEFFAELDGAEELERALDEGARLASDGIRRAVAEGVQFGADAARRDHLYRDRTHRLTDSIVGRIEVEAPGAAVGVIEARAKHAKFVEKGTEAHDIEPRKKKALHWEGPDGEHFASRVFHPGTEPRPFIAPAAAVARQHIERSIELDLLLNLERHLKD